MISSFKFGGVEQVPINLVNNLDLLRIKPIVFSLGYKDDPTLRYLRPEIQQEIHPRKWKFDMSPRDNVERIIKENNVDVIVSFNFFPAFFCLRAMRQFKNLRLILSLHTTNPSSFKEFVQTLIYSRLIPTKAEYLTICNNQKKFLSNHYHLKIDRFIDSIYNGVDTSFWKLAPLEFDRKKEREKWGIPSDAIVILNVATFKKGKRHDIMLRALAKLSSENGFENTVLVFVGGGSTSIEKDIKNLSISLNIKNKVVLTGMQSDTISFYWMSDFFTLASTAVETFSISALNGLSTGLPIVLSDIGGAKEMVEIGINGFIVKPGSVDDLVEGWRKCILSLSNFDKKIIRKYAQDRFDINIFVEKYEQLILRDKQVK